MLKTLAVVVLAMGMVGMAQARGHMHMQKPLSPCETERPAAASCACGPGKMTCPEGNVVPRLHECLQAVKSARRKTRAEAVRSLAASCFTGAPRAMDEVHDTIRWKQKSQRINRCPRYPC
jgi:hypothetical protein